MITLTLNRELFRSDGIFGALLKDDGMAICETLEHSFERKAALPSGTYVCERGLHRLAHGDPFETFEVTKVPGHTGILFHRGNYNADSKGCILVGDWLVQSDPGDMISGSQSAFARFMHELDGVETFTLVVKE
jgi:uncharacterized protein DUF5675